MTSNEFSGFLKANNINQSNVARKHDISISQVNNVARGYSKSPRVRRIIAEELGQDVNEIDWPIYIRCNNTILEEKN